MRACVHVCVHVYMYVRCGLELLKAMASVPAGGYGMDVTKKSMRDGTEVTERSKWPDFFHSEPFQLI